LSKFAGLSFVIVLLLVLDGLARNECDYDQEHEHEHEHEENRPD
jgi:hypothetical protein